MFSGVTIRGLLLDFYGTVVHDDDEPFAAVCSDVAAATGLRRHEVSTAWSQEYERLADEAHGDAFRRLRDLARDSLARTLPPREHGLDLDALLDPLYAQWTAPQAYPDALELLADPPVPVCLVSDVDDDVLLAALAHLRLDVPLRVTSEQSRAYKPAAPSFEHALGLLGLGPDEVVHVGDSLTSDVAGAHSLGIRSVWVDRTGRDAPSGDHAPTWTVRDLHPLRDLVRAQT